MGKNDTIGFCKPYLTGNEQRYIAEALQSALLAGDGSFSKRCSRWLEKNTGTNKALLTHSCTGALEMAAILAKLKPGDEVIMPSFTFVSSANAFVLRGATPVFVDIREDTLNIDETKIEKAITRHTRAIVPVHYAGVACEMDTIMNIASENKLIVIEDAAQGFGSQYRGRPLGTIGDLGVYSFHETKNVICGEGGAILVNDKNLTKRAEIIWEKGTNRSQFFRGETNKYTWLDIGSSFLPGELNAAFLWAQLTESIAIIEKRKNLWCKYHAAFEFLEETGVLRRPVVPNGTQHNAHIYYLILRDENERNKFIKKMGDEGINCVFHYIPLHNSPAGKRYGRASDDMTLTVDLASRLVRLPIWIDMGWRVDRVISTATRILTGA